MNATLKDCDLPAADSCAIMEGEDVEDDLIFTSKKSLFGKIKSFTSKVGRMASALGSRWRPGEDISPRTPRPPLFRDHCSAPYPLHSSILPPWESWLRLLYFHTNTFPLRPKTALHKAPSLPSCTPVDGLFGPFNFQEYWTTHVEVQNQPPSPKNKTVNQTPFCILEGGEGMRWPLGSTSGRSEALFWPVEAAVPWMSGPCPLRAESQLHVSCSPLKSSELGELTPYGWVNESEAHKR